MLRHREGAESVRLVVDFLNRPFVRPTPAIPVTDRRARRADVPQTIGELFAFDTLLRDDRRPSSTPCATSGTSARPNIADWFDAGSLPVRELAVELGALGLFGVQLEGYGCAGASATAYGLACQEMEAVDSGLRAASCPMQGSLAMFAIWKFGSDEQKDRAAGDVGRTRHRMLRTHRARLRVKSGSGMRTNAKRDGSDGSLNGAKMWDHHPPVADVAVVWARTDLAEGSRGIRGFVVPTDTPGFSAEIKRKLSLRASVTGDRAGRRSPPVVGDAARRRRAARPAVVSERGRASASCSAQWVRTATAWRRRSNTPAAVRSSTSRSRVTR